MGRRRGPRQARRGVGVGEAARLHGCSAGMAVFFSSMRGELVFASFKVFRRYQEHGWGRENEGIVSYVPDFGRALDGAFWTWVDLGVCGTALGDVAG
jgi:hypothetical protein